jgi:hypothetical protein
MPETYPDGIPMEAMTERDPGLGSKLAVNSAIACMRAVAYHRGAAETYGADTTSGDSGIPSLTLAAQYTAEAQAWATIALAIQAGR